MSYKNHLFICTNRPEGRTDRCGYKGSEDLRKLVKEKSQALFGREVRVNSSGCLGFCEKGIAAVIYPAGEWQLELDASEQTAEKLIQLIAIHQDSKGTHK